MQGAPAFLVGRPRPLNRMTYFCSSILLAAFKAVSAISKTFLGNSIAFSIALMFCFRPCSSHSSISAAFFQSSLYYAVIVLLGCADRC